MDIATLIGLVFGLGVIGAAISFGGDIGLFFNVPGILIVLGGTIAATLIKFRLGDILSAFALAVRTAFQDKGSTPNKIYEQVLDMAAISRKTGPLALQEYKIENNLLRQGIRLIVDGYSLENTRHIIRQEAHQMMIRQERGETMFRGIGDSAPAFGMIGTLVGLVQMLAKLDDPASIGPSMAVALLTTFYGALIANLIAIPLADKLSEKTKNDVTINELIIESIILIHQKQGSQIVAEALGVFLPGGRPSEDAQPDDGGSEAAAQEA